MGWHGVSLENMGNMGNMENMEKMENMEMFSGSPTEIFCGSPTYILENMVQGQLRIGERQMTSAALLFIRYMS